MIISKDLLKEKKLRMNWMKWTLKYKVRVRDGYDDFMVSSSVALCEEFNVP